MEETRTDRNDEIQKAIVHSNNGIDAGQQGEYDLAIQEFENSLNYNPPQNLKVGVLTNYATSIWLKNNFNSRDGSTISDEEYNKVKKVLELYSEAIALYENLPENEREEEEVKSIYEQAQNNYNAFMFYGRTREDDSGKIRFRSENKKNIINNNDIVALRIKGVRRGYLLAGGLVLFGLFIEKTAFLSSIFILGGIGFGIFWWRNSSRHWEKFVRNPSVDT